NTATSFTSTVDFSTTAGSITPTISNNFVSGSLTQNVRVTQSGSGKTITATKTGDTQFFTSNTFDVNPGTVASFIVEASGGGSIGTQTIAVPFDIKITAKDSFGNIATGFTGTADISSTGTLSSGSGITSSFTAGILSAHSVTLSNAGAFTITATRTGGSETGISNSFTVASAAIVATKFIIIDPSDVQVGGSTTVTVKAVDDLGNVDSTFQGDINLVTSGSATGSGLVDIINGVGTLNISDSVVETVNLSLSDITPPTTLIFTSTQNVIFSAIPPVVSGGGGGAVSVYVAPVIPTISFSGQAFPTGNLTAFAISNGAIPIKQDLVKTADGKFSLNFSSALSDANQYGLLITDKNGRVSQAKIFTLKDGVLSLDVKGLVMSPTVDLLRTYLSKGDFLSVSGFATPNSTVQFEIDGTVVTDKAVAAADGAYNLLWNTATLGLGKHNLRVRQTTPEGLLSEFSPTQDFSLTNYIITPTDFNSDGKINVSDMSIFLSLWYNKNNLERTKIDLNHDGKVNIQDLSIFSRTIYKK
ncbi:MAG: dockerin type I domain-containing protein, partial [Minisyncoccia bacterium]